MLLPVLVASQLDYVVLGGPPKAYHRVRAARASASDSDQIVLLGDGAALLGYGTVQALVDIALGPIASLQPQLFVNDQPLQQPLWQAALLAALWIAIAQATGGYNAARTRGGEGLLPALALCVLPWLLSCGVLLLSLALAETAFGVGPGASAAEATFLFGSGTVVGGWRLVCASLLPPPE